MIFDKDEYDNRLKIAYAEKVDYDRNKYTQKVIDELNNLDKKGGNNQKQLSLIYRKLTGKRIGVRKVDRINRINNTNRNRYQVQVKLTIENEIENEQGEVTKKITEV